MKNHNRISSRGIMTLSVLATLMSLPLVEHLHQLEMKSRSLHNTNYNGSYGGEVLIPLIIIIGTVIILCEKDRRRYAKYNKR